MRRITTNTSTTNSGPLLLTSMKLSRTHFTTNASAPRQQLLDKTHSHKRPVQNQRAFHGHPTHQRTDAISSPFAPRLLLPLRPYLLHQSRLLGATQHPPFHPRHSHLSQEERKVLLAPSSQTVTTPALTTNNSSLLCRWDMAGALFGQLLIIALRNRGMLLVCILPHPANVSLTRFSAPTLK